MHLETGDLGHSLPIGTGFSARGSRCDHKLRAQQGTPGDASHEESLLPDCPAQHNAVGRTFARAFE